MSRAKELLTPALEEVEVMTIRVSVKDVPIMLTLDPVNFDDILMHTSYTKENLYQKYMAVCAANQVVYFMFWKTRKA